MILKINIFNYYIMESAVDNLKENVNYTFITMTPYMAEVIIRKILDTQQLSSLVFPIQIFM